MPTTTREAIITVTVWSDSDDPSSPPLARFLTSHDGGEPEAAGYARGIDQICESVLAFLLLHFA